VKSGRSVTSGSSRLGPPAKLAQRLHWKSVFGGDPAPGSLQNGDLR